MKKYYLLLLFVTSFVGAQIVNIPDANFKAKLLSASADNYVAYNGTSYTKIDSNDDGEIQFSEALEITKMYLGDASIINLVGLESFTNLTEFSSVSNPLLSLNLTAFPNLTSLTIVNSQLNVIDLSGLVNLTSLTITNNFYISTINLVNLVNLNNLNLNNNNIAALDVGTLVNLKSLSCESNDLVTLDLSNQAVLEYLYASSNVLTSIIFNTSANLKKVHCSYNQLTSLDFSSFPTLEEIYCGSNMLTNLNVDNLVYLESLICLYNQLPQLDISDLTSLHSLQCGYNLLTTLNLNGQSFLSILGCNNNLLTTVDFTSLNFITNISVGNDGFLPMNLVTIPNLNGMYVFSFWGGVQTSLDLSMFPNLTQASLYNTNITTLDLSQNTKLTDFAGIDNQDLVSLNLKNGKSESISLIMGSPNLAYVCADENQISYVQNKVGSNVMVSSYCNFTPGGNYNTITGSMLFGSNSNGCDVADLPQPNMKVTINDGTNQGATFTNNSGNYNFYTQAGSFNISPNVENPTWFNVSPATATIPFANNNNNTTTQNFCITPNGIHPDLEIVIVPVIPARPGFDAVYKIVYKNKGNQTVSGIVNFIYNDAVLDFVSSSVIPSNSGSGFMNWTISNVAPFQVGTFLVTFNVNSPQEIPAVNIDDVLSFNATITTPSDDNLADNSFDFDQIVVGSYDPNDITCLEGNSLPLVDIGAYLHYNIRFENTGTAAAENIVVASAINLSQYNIQSLQVMESSHPMEVKITGNMAEFIFQTINLDAGGHGNILLKMKSNNVLSNNYVMNSADIFFDYNFPIETNDEQTVFAELSKNDFNKELNLQIYPNPTDNIITIKSDATINTIQLYDAQGRILQTIMTSEVLQTVDLSAYATGIYYVSIATDNGKQTQKVIKK